MDELDLADLAAEHDPARFLMHRLVALIEDDAELHAVPAASCDRRGAFADRHRQRLLDERVLAGLGGRNRVLRMQRVRRRVIDRVDPGIAQSRVERGMDLGDAMRRGKRRAARRVAAHDGDKLRLGGLLHLRHDASRRMPSGPEESPADRHVDAPSRASAARSPFPRQAP